MTEPKVSERDHADRLWIKYALMSVAELIRAELARIRAEQHEATKEAIAKSVRSKQRVALDELNASEGKSEEAGMVGDAMGDLLAQLDALTLADTEPKP